MTKRSYWAVSTFQLEFFLAKSTSSLVIFFIFHVTAGDRCAYFSTVLLKCHQAFTQVPQNPSQLPPPLCPRVRVPCFRLHHTRTQFSILTICSKYLLSCTKHFKPWLKIRIPFILITNPGFDWGWMNGSLSGSYEAIAVPATGIITKASSVTSDI